MNTNERASTAINARPAPAVIAPHPEPEAHWYTFDGTASCIVRWGDRKVTLYRSRTGRSFRIWVDGEEWKR